MTTVTKLKRRKTLASTRGRQIIADLKAVAESLEKGSAMPFTKRTVSMPDNPREYDGAGVKATRQKLGASQAIFAKLLGVSAVLVRSLEQGQRKAAPVVRRLLDEINRNPDQWRTMIAPKIK